MKIIKNKKNQTKQQICNKIFQKIFLSELKMIVSFLIIIDNFGI